MRKRIISALLCIAMTGTVCASLSVTALADGAKTPQYQEKARRMEELNRGLIAVKTTKDTREQTVDGVVLSWRLLGDESLENQAFDIYRDETKIHTTGPHDATYYVDTAGTATNKYKVVKKDATAAEVAAETAVTPTTTFAYARTDEIGKGNSLQHSFTYVDIPIKMPTDITHANTTALSDYKRNGATGGANDASVGDLDGDGDYEIVLKWDPVDSCDAAATKTTGNCVLDAYEIDPNNDGYMWRIDLGQNITSGAHSTQFIVYDFDGDGKAEIACQTAEGSYSIDSDGKKHFVTEVGDSEDIRNGDNTATHLSKGKNIGADYLTIFDGETGKPLKTTAGIPLGSANGADWGDSKLNRSSRYLAGVAYLDGINPYFIAVRGYYNKTVIRAYLWDGEDFSLYWEHNGNTNGTTMYGQGNHNLSIADVDNDGKDEIVYGSATLDDDGKTMIDNIKTGHGDAMHVSDFDNDGWQEVFSVKEDTSDKMRTGANFRRPSKGGDSSLFSLTVNKDGEDKDKDGKPDWPDVGRGLMGNIDDTYASTHPNALSLAWDSYHPTVYGTDGTALKAKPSGAGKGSFDNFLVYWDGDLASELLDANIIQKYDAENGWTKRFYGPNDGYTLSGQTNNDTKRNCSLVADLWGDWREEIIMPIDDSTPDAPKLRIFTSIVPTEYRLTTLMHDSQYRCAIAWQNVAYNQPPHTSYYIGSAALATDASGNKLNYLAPATPFTKVKYASSVIENPVTGISLSKDSVRLEKGESELIQAIITPENADKKTVTWSTSDENVATVANGTIKAVGKGTATITATAKDTTKGTFSAQCQVEVFATDVTGIQMPGYDNITIMQGGTAKINASVVPSNATVKTINWSSTNPNVAAVDSDGVVTGVGPGSAIIRAVTAEGGFMGEKIVSVAGKVTDKTGTNEFTKEGESTETTITTDAKSASINQKAATAGASVQKTFEVMNEGQAKLSFRFNTGGQRVDGSSSGGVNFTGHEYTYGIQFLDESNNNILRVSQAQTSSAQATKSQVGTEEEKTASSDWKLVENNSNSPFGRSMSTWKVDIEFNYTADSATARITGGDGSGDVYEKTFNLNGAKFAALKMYTTKDKDNATVTVTPSISNLVYQQALPSDGVGSKLYDKATLDANKWTDADVSDWTLEGETVAAPAVDAANNRIWYNPPNPGGSYSATKTFDIAEDALVTYDLDWYTGLSPNGSKNGSDTNYEYIQFGSKLRLGWNRYYQILLSTDGGETYGETELFKGASGSTYTKNVHLVVDTATNEVKSFKLDGADVALPADFAFDSEDTFDSVSFGMQALTVIGDWNYPNGLDNLTVLQFVEGAEQEQEVEPYVAVASAGGKTVTAEFAAASGDDKIIGALYDGTALKEVKWADISSLGDFTANKVCTGDLTFDNDVSGCKVKLFMWNGLGENGLKPAVPAAQYE